MPSAIKKNTLLIVKLDNIGDYILFRNFLKVLRADGKYKNYKITLIANSAVKELAEFLDKEFIDKFIWIDKPLFNNSFFYKMKILLAIRGFEVLVNPTYSRTSEYDDEIAKYSKAQYKICSSGDSVNMKKEEYSIPPKYYSQIIESPPEIIFEFFRNKIFFQNLLINKIDIEKPFIEFQGISKNYILIFPGGSFKEKKWPDANYIELITLLLEASDSEIIVIGGKSEMDIANLIEINFVANKRIKNLINKLGLVDVLNYLAASRFLIGNESFAIHLAACLNVPFICIANGHNFLRFSPYPPDIIPLKQYIFPFDYSYNHSQSIALNLKVGTYFKNDNIPNINQISINAVMNRIMSNGLL